MMSEQTESTGKTENEEEQATPSEEFSWEKWLGEGRQGMRFALREYGIPAEFWEHVDAAHEEMRYAGTVLIGAALRGDLGKRLHKAMRRAMDMGTAGSTTPHRATRIKVE